MSPTPFGQIAMFLYGTRKTRVDFVEVEAKMDKTKGKFIYSSFSFSC